MDWDGQVAVVTGGSREIGAAIARRLAFGVAVGTLASNSTRLELLIGSLDATKCPYLPALRWCRALST
jgi:NAD(P)-dependent dehydrogenase (short-subunit alcohol dehydrogenase family)